MSTTTTRDPTPPRATRPARITFALLLVATPAALLVAQHLKSRHALVDSGAWSPAGRSFDAAGPPAKFSFKAYYDDEVTVSIVAQANGHVVAVVARDAPVTGYVRSTTFRWDGRTASGALAPAGDYEVEVHFARLDRTTIVPEIELEVGR